jgi:chaperonin cofactor prefoldin
LRIPKIYYQIKKLNIDPQGVEVIDPKMILDLKRKIDGMEFDLDTLNGQEKKSLASKVDLESKLDKAIKTLRSAITILESEENSRTPLLDKLKKNLDM